LFRAINDILIYLPKQDKERQRLGDEAISWFFSDEDNEIMDTGTFTFNYVCYLLKLNKSKSRLYLNWQLDKQKCKLSENEFLTFLELCIDD